MVIEQQVEGQTVQCVEEAEFHVIIFIPHILHHILREQIIPKAVVVVVYKLRRRHVGLHLVLLFCIRPQKFERLRLFVKML